jgi:polar amino acid transport system substrate-binding protein
MKMKQYVTRFLPLLLIMAMMLIPLASCAKKSSVLVVGMELQYPPFETTDEKGNPTGISVDIAMKLGEYLGRSVRIENTSYSGLIPALQSKKIDIILSSMTITDKRKESIDFSDPYAQANLALLIANGSAVQSSADLVAGRKIAVKKGTTAHVYSEEHFKDAEVLVFDTEGACILEVITGKADVFIYDQMSIYKAWKTNPDTTRANLEPFAANPENWGIGLRKGEDAFRGQINAFIKESKGNGFFGSLADKYLKDMKAVFDELKIPFFF